METTVLKRVVAYVSLVGREPTAPSLIVLVAARTKVAVWMENVTASKASPGWTVDLKSALWTVVPMATVWMVFASVQMVILEKTALRVDA